MAKLHTVAISMLPYCYVQCSSDISELRIRVLYARILRIRVCLYAYTRMSIRVYVYVYTRIRICQYARICPFVMHSHKFLCMKHCWSNKGHMGMKRLQIFVKTTCRSMKAITFQVFDHANSSTVSLTLA